MSGKLDPITPGEILCEEFLIPMGISRNRLARAIDVPAGRINEIVLNRRSITRDTAARLSVYFSTTADFWLNLQAHYDAKITSSNLVSMFRSMPSDVHEQ